MSFSNVGNLLTTITTRTGSVADVLKSMGDVNTAANALNVVGKSIDIDKFTLLKTAFPSIEDSALKTALGIDAISDASVVAGNSSNKLVNGFKGFGATLKPLLPTILGVAAAIAALVAAYKIFEYSQTAYTRSFEKFEKASSDYSEAKNELNSLNSELETTKARIQELIQLQNDGVITFAEEVELEKLQKTNDELEREVSLKERLAKIQGEAAANAAINVSETEKSFTENLRDKNGDKKGILSSILYYITDAPVLDEFGNLSSTRKLISKWEEADTSTNGRVEYLINQLKAQEEALNDVTEDLLYDPDDKILNTKKEQIETELQATTDALIEESKELDNLISSVTDENGVIDKKYQLYVEEWQDALNMITNIDKTAKEIELNNLENFFSKKSGNYLKKELEEIAKESKNTEEVLESFRETGLTLEDIEVSEEGFLKYFEDIVNSAEEAKEVINSVEGTVQAVTDAFESENKNKNWVDMSDYLDKANDLFKDGLIGTDDFKTAVQFISPDIIDADDGYKYDADAYVKAWQDAKDKVKRYFDKDNPLKSMYNFSEDLVKGGLATKVGDEYTWAFESSAQAADALGLSLDAVEVIMCSLEAYGAEFDGVSFSGEMLSDYETALNGIKDIRDSIEDDDIKQNLDLKIDGWEKEYAHLSENLDELTEEQVIQIKFEYDLATIQAQIEEFQNRYNETGSAEDQASINIAKRRYRETREEQVKYNENSGDSAYSASYGQIESLQSQLKLPETSEETKTSLREQISLIYDMQNAFLDFRAEGGTLDWSDYLNSDEGQTVLSDLVSETELTVEQIEELLGSDLNLKVKTEQPEKIETEDVVIEATLDDEELSKKLASAKAGTKIVFTAEVDGVEREITAVKNEDGTVTYTANVDGLEKELEVHKNADGTINYSLGKQAAPLSKTAILDYIKGDQAPPIPQVTDVHYKKGYQEEPEDKFAKVNYVQGSIPSVGSALAANRGNVALLSTAHASGTAYNVLNMIPAYSNGKVSLSQDETALVNELGTESIIRDGKWFLIPGGMHTENLKKGDIVLSASQTKQLLNYGRASGHGHSYAYGTLSNAYANGWNPFGSLNYAQSIGGENNQKSNSKSSSNSSSSSDSEAENFNWIEVALSRIQRLITNVGKTVSATYKKWSERNKAIGDEISLITDEISLQQQAYDKYMQLADSVGLSEHYKKLVQSGAIDYESISDKNLAEQIKKYQEFFEAALDCVDAVQDLEDELASLAKEKFDNVVSEYDDKLSVIEHRISMIEGIIDKTEEQGYLVSSSYYTELIKQEMQNISILEKEYSALVSARDEAMKTGEIAQYSEDWYEMESDIMEVEEALLDANTALVEYNNSLRELKWDRFDRLIETMSGINSEADFLKELLSYGKLIDDKGLYSNLGQAVQGLNAVNMNAYFAQAEEYKREIAEINNLLADDPYNTTLLERRNELEESWRDTIISAKDAQQEMMDMEEERYDALLSYMQNAIDKQKEQNQRISDQRDFQRTIEEQTKTVADLRKISISVQGDDSEANRLFLQKNNEELKKVEEDLQDTLYDKYIKDQEQLYDSILSQTETWINERLDDQNLLTQMLIDSTNTNAESIKQTLQDETGAVGTTLSDKMDAIWSTGGTYSSVVASYQENFGNLLTTTNGILSGIKDTIDKMANISDNAAKNEQTSKTPPTTPSVGNNNSSSAPSQPNNTSTVKEESGSVTNGWGGWFIPLKSSYPKSKLNTNQSIVDRLKYFDYSSNFADRASYYRAMGGSGTYTGSASQNTWMISEMRKHGFAQGGTIGGLIKSTGEDGFVLARAGESIINVDQMRELQKTLVAAKPLVDGLKNIPTINPASGVGTTVLQTGDINMYEVNDAETFANQLVHELKYNPKVTKIIQADTLGAMLGKNSLTKHMY